MEEYLEVLDLKDTARTGWEIYNVVEPETVAAHSWSVALLTMIHLPKDLDMEKALEMAVIHDIGESVIGDVPYRASGGHQQDKSVKEHEAVEEISEALHPDIIELYKDYDARESREAEFVKDMDLIDMVLQALKYEVEERYEGNPDTDYDNLDEFFETSRSRFRTEKGLKLFQEIEEKYVEVK